MSAVRVVVVFGSLVPLLLGLVTRAGAAEPPFHALWRQGHDVGFERWTLVGAAARDGRLELANSRAEADTSPTDWEAVEQLGVAAQPGQVGVALGPVVEAAELFRELIPSWNATTPAGTWIEIRLRARIDDRWTGWYHLGVWSSGPPGERRRSVAGQDDGDARVLTDTLALRRPASAYQVGVVLRSEQVDVTPALSMVAVLASRASPNARPDDGDTSARGLVLEVPQRSQMVYPGGGEVWCSPTSTSMVMAYWSERLGRSSLDVPVPRAAAATYDPVYRGHGNWPFNTAFAATDGLLGYVTRFSSAGQLERWIAAEVPVVTSLAWGHGELPGAPISSTSGHLLVVVGFDAAGNVVVNEPAADPRRGESVRRVYPRGAFESLWLRSSGGTVYLIYPHGHTIPADGAFGAW